jgi:hypothetical protein
VGPLGLGPLGLGLEVSVVVAVAVAVAVGLEVGLEVSVVVVVEVVGVEEEGESHRSDPAQMSRLGQISACRPLWMRC